MTFLSFFFLFFMLILPFQEQICLRILYLQRLLNHNKDVVFLRNQRFKIPLDPLRSRLFLKLSGYTALKRNCFVRALSKCYSRLDLAQV